MKFPQSKLTIFLAKKKKKKKKYDVSYLQLLVFSYLYFWSKVNIWRGQ